MIRKLVQRVIDNIYICAARQLTGETHSLLSSKRMFPNVKKTISVIALASDSDFGFVSLPIKEFEDSREICLMLHESTVPSVTTVEGVDRIERVSGPKGYTTAIQNAVLYAKENHPSDTLTLIIDADTCRTGENGSVKRPSLALIRSDGSIPGTLDPNPNFETSGGRKFLYHTEPNNQTQLTPTAEENSRIILACANVGIRLGYGMMVFPMKNNWEDYAKGGNNPFQQGLNGGGVRIFLDSKAFDGYLGLNVNLQEEDYKTNVFLAKNFGGKTTFVPRFFSISYMVLWGNKTITRSKVSIEYRRYLLREVIEPLNELGLKAIIVGGKGEKAANVPRLTRHSSKINEFSSKSNRFSKSEKCDC
jgi:hypothetical protein